MSTSDHFYRDLKILETFDEATNGLLHAKVPEDWWIVVADVLGSTEAIEKGRYKDVNVVGASTIVAVLNVDRGIEVPFLFGGDGATLAIPPSMRKGTAEALLGVHKLAREAFGLDLRVGMIPTRDLWAQDFRIHIGKYRLSPVMCQPAFSGRGWDEAERLLKDPATRRRYEIKDDGTLTPKADLTGFECRWRNVPSLREHKLSLIVTSLCRTPEDHAKTYRLVMRKIKDVYGGPKEFHPLRTDKLNLSLSAGGLRSEALVRTFGKSWRGRIGYFFKMILQNVVGLALFRYSIDTRAVKWSHYKQELLDNADFRKFDGALKMILDGTESQARELETFLIDLNERGLIAYGLHRSTEALITCIVFSHATKHVHFIDGASGGYAMAARQLKYQITTFKRSAAA